MWMDDEYVTLLTTNHYNDRYCNTDKQIVLLFTKLQQSLLVVVRLKSDETFYAILHFYSKCKESIHVTFVKNVLMFL